MVSSKKSDIKLFPEELRGKDKAVASMEQGNRSAAADSRHVGRTAGRRWLETA